MTFEEVISRIIDEGFNAYEAGNPSRALALLLPIQAFDHRVDFYLAMVYSFSEAKDFQKAKKHLESYRQRSANSPDRVDDEFLDMFLRSICLSEGDYDTTEAFALQEVARGDESHYLTLAFHYVNQAQHFHLALIFAELGEEYLNRLPEEKRQEVLGRAGYHVAACVYIWHRLYDKAQSLEHHFLDRQHYEDHNLNGGYLLLALGIGDAEYLSGLFDRFDLKNRYPYHHYYFHYCIQNPNERMPKALDSNARHLFANVGYTRKKYAEDSFYYLALTDFLPNISDLLARVQSITPVEWKRLLALQTSLQSAHVKLVSTQLALTVRETLESIPNLLLPFDWRENHELYGGIESHIPQYRRYHLVELCMTLTLIYHVDSIPKGGLSISDLIESGEILHILTAIERKI